jgi:hypothetical protein
LLKKKGWRVDSRRRGLLTFQNVFVPRFSLPLDPAGTQTPRREELPVGAIAGKERREAHKKLIKMLKEKDEELIPGGEAS